MGTVAQWIETREGMTAASRVRRVHMMAIGELGAVSYAGEVS